MTDQLIYVVMLKIVGTSPLFATYDKKMAIKYVQEHKSSGTLTIESIPVRENQPPAQTGHDFYAAYCFYLDGKPYFQSALVRMDSDVMTVDFMWKLRQKIADKHSTLASVIQILNLFKLEDD